MTGRVSAAELSGLLARALGGLSGGSVQIGLGAAPFASVDAESRTLKLQIAPLLLGSGGTRPMLRASGPRDLWKARNIPAQLARSGWRLTLYDGTQELLSLGRGTSALTGHIHLNPTALWTLRKLV